MQDAALLAELTPVLGELFDRHVTTSKPWYPHELVPWSRGRDFEPGGEWDPDECPLPDAVRSSLFVNLLTEDNLPYYFNEIARTFRTDAFDEWARRWTAEEMRHSIVIRDYLTVTRAIDPWELERARMSQVSGGQVPHPPSVVDSVIYVTLQELATRVAHRNTGKLLDDKVGYEIMSRVATDENFHFLFYRDLASKALELDPSAFVCAVERQVREFEMPGTGIPDFGKHAMAIAKAGIYDFENHHDVVLAPVVLRHWKLEELTGLSDEAEAARHRTLKYLNRVSIAGKRMSDRRAREQELASV